MPSCMPLGTAPVLSSVLAISTRLLARICTISPTANFFLVHHKMQNLQGVLVLAKFIVFSSKNMTFGIPEPYLQYRESRFDIGRQQFFHQLQYLVALAQFLTHCCASRILSILYLSANFKDACPDTSIQFLVGAPRILKPCSHIHVVCVIIEMVEYLLVCWYIIFLILFDKTYIGLNPNIHNDTIN